MMPAQSDPLLSLYQAAIDGADPGPATARAVDTLHIPRDRRVLVFAVGKAAATMAAATVATLLRSLHQIVGGVIVSPDGERSPYPTLISLKGDHPIPGPLSHAAAEKIGEVAAGRRATDVAIVLVSGGASSLIASPLRGHEARDLVALYQSLLASGIDISTMNAVRKRFSRWGGGRLAMALAPAAVHCLAVSDVPGDGLEVIGSGPCTPDRHTAAEISAIIDQAGLGKGLAPVYREYLRNVVRGVAGETPKKHHPAFAHVTSSVVASNRSALDQAAAAAAALGMRPEIVEDLLDGSAANAGESIARKLLSASATRNGATKCMIWGGETTVAAGSPEAMGAGGRCQELALAAARVLGESGERASRIRLLAAGTDGRDGMTDAAGAMIDFRTWDAIRDAGTDPLDALQRHQSTRALSAANALVPRRRTGTNVMDIAIGIVE
jgi:hydroxypyruvate reductase